jgi:hypothetical protein
MLKSLLVGLFALGTALVASRADACATAYKRPHYRGDYMRIDEGRMRRMPDDWDNSISSIKVDRDCYIELWERPNYRGESETYYEDTPELDEWDNRASSSYCSCH